MPGTGVVGWTLAAAMLALAARAGRRLCTAVRERRADRVAVIDYAAHSDRGAARGVLEPVSELVMPLGMAAMAILPMPSAAPGARGWAGAATFLLAAGFAVLGLALLAAPIAGRFLRPESASASSSAPESGPRAAVRHRLHHAVMAGIMTLMLATSRGAAGTSVMMPAMTSSRSGTAMPNSASDMPYPGTFGALLLAAFAYLCILALVRGWRLSTTPADSGHVCVAHGCEIIMLVAMAVMLLPMI